MTLAALDEPTCGALDCHEPASKRVDHPERGEIVVCDSHAAEHEVVRFDV